MEDKAEMDNRPFTLKIKITLSNQQKACKDNPSSAAKAAENTKATRSFPVFPPPHPKQ